MLGAVKPTCIVGIDAFRFFGVDHRIINDLERFVCSGVLTDVLVANKYILARPIVLDPPFNMRIQVNILGLTSWHGLLRRGSLRLDIMASGLAQLCRLNQTRARWLFPERYLGCNPFGETIDHQCSCV